MQKLKKSSAIYQKGTTSTRNCKINNLVKKLADYTLWDHEIDLKPKISPKFFPIYKLTKVEKQALKEFV